MRSYLNQFKQSYLNKWIVKIMKLYTVPKMMKIKHGYIQLYENLYLSIHSIIRVDIQQ